MAEAELCGMIPEETDAEFVAQHLSAYAFMRPAVGRERVLEVGFGDGYGAAYLSEAAREVVGVDVTVPNIPRAQAKYRRANLSFQPFDGLHLPFPEESFDAAGTFQVIEHVPEPDLVPWLTEIRRVLKRRGRLYLSTLNLEQAMKPGRPYEKLIYHQKEFTAPELESLLRKVFPAVTLYGLHRGLKHRFFRRLKKWGLPVNGYYSRITIRDFVVERSRIRRAADLLAVCRKE
ncbi:MAG: class I SAM-dependent methyltransferase [Candidatus Omnitrophica bacterium]|nr:class I SAM-dependent methyltransferase [Candidatus Omnitrophota bacterium]